MRKTMSGEIKDPWVARILAKTPRLAETKLALSAVSRVLDRRGS